MTWGIDTSEPPVADALPIEDIVDFCNDCGLPAWLDLSRVDASVAGPIADDVRARLNPDLPLYLQHGDRVTKR